MLTAWAPIFGRVIQAGQSRLDTNLLNVGQESVARLVLVAFWLTFYWVASPVTADPRGVAEETPKMPKVVVPYSRSS